MIDSNKSIHWAIVDVEVSLSDQRIHDIGVLRYDGAVYHGCSKEDFEVFVQDAEFICGHNIIHHDAKFLFTEGKCSTLLVDTLGRICQYADISAIIAQYPESYYDCKQQRDWDRLFSGLWIIDDVEW